MQEPEHNTSAQKEYVIVNVYEEVVRDNVLKMIDYMEMCSCEKCICDVCALVLNDIKPLYVTTRKGSLLSKLKLAEQHIDLTVKVVNAMQLVKESPRH